MPGVPHPIPFRTRSLSPPGPMVLRLKARESRSPPGPLKGCSHQVETSKSNPTHDTPTTNFAAGWSSPVARQAHNLKVTGSNPVPAPKNKNGLLREAIFVRGSLLAKAANSSTSLYRRARAAVGQLPLLPISLELRSRRRFGIQREKCCRLASTLTHSRPVRRPLGQ